MITWKDQDQKKMLKAIMMMIPPHLPEEGSALGSGGASGRSEAERGREMEKEGSQSRLTGHWDKV